MASVDLVLGELGAYLPPPGGQVHLLLGDTNGAEGVLTGVGFGLTLRLRGAAEVGVATLVGSGPVRLPSAEAARGPAGAPDAPWGAFDGYRTGHADRLPWSAFNGHRVGHDDRAPWGAAAPRQDDRRLPWGAAALHLVQRRAPWSSAVRDDRATRMPWGAAAPRSARLEAARWARAAGRQRPIRLPWNDALLLVAPNVPLPRPPGSHGSGIPGGALHLHFCVPAADSSLDLRFGAENCLTQPRIPDGTYIASRSSYVQTHAITAYRLPDLTPLDLTGFTLEASADAVCWSLNAQGPDSLLALLQAAPGDPPMLMQLNVDGMTWEFIIEAPRRVRSHGKTTVQFSGRSQTMLLGDPYFASSAFLNAVPMTAQQLVLDALQFTGVDLEWQVVDWTVPAGAWSFSGTPLAATVAVAGSIGAVVASPRAGATLQVLPRYPMLPWNWAAEVPDVVIEFDPLASEGYERADKPPYDGVYVSGQAQGVLALVKRTGSGPSVYLPMITDPLLTHVDACRQRGEAMLGAAGPQANVTETLPVFTSIGEPGVIDIGKLVQINDPAGAWKGLVRAVSVAYTRPRLMQILTLERHL